MHLLIRNVDFASILHKTYLKYYLQLLLSLLILDASHPTTKVLSMRTGELVVYPCDVIQLESCLVVHKPLLIERPSVNKSTGLLKDRTDRSDKIINEFYFSYDSSLARSAIYELPIYLCYAKKFGWMAFIFHVFKMYVSNNLYAFLVVQFNAQCSEAVFPCLLSRNKTTLNYHGFMLHDALSLSTTC
ncbi:hypothetical protein EGR_08957 [Echinococcus granulosus]|uniref:Uncharacterized protein n=1 Tax=Echinococcus granulosus TaxID=6210 RepID=W6US04_ECHGR|nr:hypothetical protein EGR_08957 [Echinococcus granulosus]EUB56209.1 hypothetical protein EGR_08957 [Echinococcus granulosus]